MQELLKKTRRLLVKALQSAATTAVESDVVDTVNYQGVVFTSSIGTANAGNLLKVQQGDESNGSDMTDLVGASAVAAENGDAVVVDVYKPTKRYVRAVIVRAASTATAPIHAELYDPRKHPVTHGATVAATSVVSPAEAE